MSCQWKIADLLSLYTPHIQHRAALINDAADV